MKKILALILMAALLLGIGGCSAPAGDPNAATTAPGTTAPQVHYDDPFASYTDYAGKSKAIYDANLGEFYAAYQLAMAAENQSQRWALLAIAEAKLLESAVILPLGTNGGHYAISRVAPYTAPYAQWGEDSYRWHNLVVTDDIISNAHRQEMALKWEELKGSGEYESWAEKYLKKAGYSLKKTYTRLYTAAPKSWDILGTADPVSAQALVNTYDGLVEYDAEGRLRPAIAQEWSKTVNEDGTVTYTFKLRSQTNWVGNNGDKFDKVTADDFVAGFQHMLDAASGKEELVRDIIVNAKEYLDGTITDFAQVGVKAENNTTLTYTLTKDVPYFLTMLGHSVFAPLNRDYYISLGGAFGAEYTAAFEAGTYLYGTAPEYIAYCGAYIPKVDKETGDITFSANRYYRNYKSMNIKTVKWIYDDGTDELRGYNDTVSGVIDETGLNDAATGQAKTDGILETLAYTTQCDVTAFVGYYNLNRAAYANANDGAVASPKTPAEQIRTVAAMHNVHFRRALSMALDRGAYNATIVGEELKLVSLRNSYTPGNFVWLTEDVTVAINGTDTQFPEGTYYGAIIQAQLDADGFKAQVWKTDETTGIGSSDGFDGWYNEENAVAELNIAISEIQALGVEISAESPIYLDLPYYADNGASAQRAQACKTSVENALGKKVLVNLVPCSDVSALYCAGFYFSSGSQMNYDIYDVSGWIANYGDPQNYLEGMLPSGNGIKALGIY